MDKTRILNGLLKLGLMLCMVAGIGSALAGYYVYTSGVYAPPSPGANLYTIDFSTRTFATEQTASRLTYSSAAGASQFLKSGGSISYTSSVSESGFSGNAMKISSGTTSNYSTVTVNFVNPTPYVGLMWRAQFTSENSQILTLTLSDGSTKVLKNCSSSSNNQCIGMYVDNPSWLTSLLNLLLGWLLGDAITWYPIYVQYTPDSGVKVSSMQFKLYNCGGCGFLSSDTSQDWFVDSISYIDGSAAPHHLELTTASSSVSVNAATTLRVKACGDATCATPYQTGISGTIGVSGVSASYTAAWSIPAGTTHYVDVSVTPTASGTATLSVPTYSPTPSNTPKVFCGMGVAAASGNACTLSVLGLHHLEVTTGAASGNMGSAVTYTIKACSDAACTTTYTSGVTGTFTISGLTVSPSASQAFSIGSGSATTTVNVTPSAAGTATASLSGVSPAASGSPATYCGIGAAAASGNSCAYTANQTLDHVEVTLGSGTNVTCTPLTYTVKACGNAACSLLYTLGLTGTLTASGVTVNYPSGQGFTIGGGSSSTTVSAHATTAGTATVSLSGLSVTPLGSPATYCGMGAAASSGGSCGATMVSSALLFDVPHHLSDASQSVTISAVRSSNNATVCAPAFASVSKNVTFKCTYTNPTSGTLPVRVGGSALNTGNSTSSACDGTGRAVSLSFNASGVATTTVQYADVGQMGVTATYSGSGSDAGLSMTGSDSFIASPASFAFSSITASPVAGSNFSATLTAKNSSGVAVPNFGKETSVTQDYVRLAWAKFSPTGLAAVLGTFTGTGSTGSSPYISSSSFSGGAVTLSDLMWTEVGTGDLSASLVSTSYLGTGTAVTGNTGGSGGVGPFVPHHLTASITQGCGSSFTYSGQPFSLTLTAVNANGTITANYDGSGSTSPSFARAITLSLQGGGASSGSLNSSSVALSSFTAGQASIPSTGVSPFKFTFTNKLTAATSVTVRATESTSSISSSGYDATLSARSGRIKISNAFGSEKSSLDIPVQAQYWNGKTWVINSDDNCTYIPVASVVRTNYLDYKGGATSSWTTTPATKATVSSVPMAVAISGGNGTLTLGAPSPTSTGSVDFAFNLGGSSSDQSCLASHPASTAANVDWLRSLNGSTNTCSGLTSYDRDPSGRVTFGVYKPETKKAVFVRDLY